MAKMKKLQTRLAKKTKVETIDDAMNNFKSEVKKQPVYICTLCHRLLWRKGVQKFSIEKYNKVRPVIIQLVLDDKYRLSSIDGSTYICHSCHRTLKLGRIPAQSKANRMELEEIPDELKNLNNLELHFICKRILFMKLVKLPRGKQKGIRGAAVNVPADLGPASTLLPRLPADAHIVSLKLKRKLEYKQAYLHDVICPEKVISALHNLKNNNPLYAEIEINEDWIRGWQDGDNDMYDGIFLDENDKAEASNHKQMPNINCDNVPLDNIDDSDCDSNESDSDKTQQDNSNEIEKEDLIALEENCKLRDLPYDTCPQSELPGEANQVFSIAPGQGNRPIPLLTDTLFEELANLDKFPFGKGGFVDTERDTKLTLRKYVNAHLLHQDGHFAKDIKYIFAMQYAVGTTCTSVIKLQNGLGQMKKRKRKAVICWHNFNIEKEHEKHYRSRIMLFLPWRREEKLWGNYMLYEDRYNDEIEQIKATEKMFIHQEDEINSAFEHLQVAGPPQAAWDNIAPGTEEADELAHQEGISDECPMAEEDIQHHINQIVNHRPQPHNESLNTKYTKEARKVLLSPCEYNKCMRQLNTEQRTMVMYHRNWCKETVIALKQHKPVKPHHVFFSGSGGVGKSYIVKMLHTDTVKLFQCSQQIKPENVPILLTAATGVAAHNINRITVHSAFMLNDRNKAGTTYYNLGLDTLSTLQTHLEQLMVVIIDEISMIGAQTLYKIHMRLQEIKGLHYSNTWFGNVTIIAVGDLYQLPPLKDKEIYDTPGTGDDPNPVCLHQSLWKENFYFHELKHVMGQKNKHFA